MWSVCTRAWMRRMPTEGGSPRQGQVGCTADHPPARPATGRPAAVPLDHRAGGGMIELLTEGDELYAAMAQAIAAARRRIGLASYILAADAIGEPLLDLLMERARAGVDVRIQVDAVGSAGLLPRRWQRRLEAAGVRVHRFHRWRWRDRK